PAATARTVKSSRLPPILPPRLGLVAGHRGLNGRPDGRRGLGAQHHGRLLGQPFDDFDAAAIAQPDLDRETLDSVVLHRVDETAGAVRLDRRSRQSERVEPPVHFQRNLGIGARIKPFVGVRQVNLGTHVAGLGIETQGEAGYPAHERLTVEPSRLDDGWLADVKVRYVVLRNVAKYPDGVDPLHREK